MCPAGNRTLDKQLLTTIVAYKRTDSTWTRTPGGAARFASAHSWIATDDVASCTAEWSRSTRSAALDTPACPGIDSKTWWLPAIKITSDMQITAWKLAGNIIRLSWAHDLGQTLLHELPSSCFYVTKHKVIQYFTCTLCTVYNVRTYIHMHKVIQYFTCTLCTVYNIHITYVFYDTYMNKNI
jgi:hypothetical protein